MRITTVALLGTLSLGALSLGAMPAAAQTAACTAQGANNMVCEARVTLAIASPVEIRLAVPRTPSGTAFSSLHAAAELTECAASQGRGAPHVITLGQAPQTVSLMHGGMAPGSYCARIQIMACRRNGENASCQLGFQGSVMVVLRGKSG